METPVIAQRGVGQWSEPPYSEHSRLLEAFGHYQDQLPPSCSLELKIDRLRSWLLARGIEYRHTR